MEYIGCYRERENKNERIMVYVYCNEFWVMSKSKNLVRYRDECRSIIKWEKKYARTSAKNKIKRVRKKL